MIASSSLNILHCSTWNLLFNIIPLPTKRKCRSKKKKPSNNLLLLFSYCIKDQSILTHANYLSIKRLQELDFTAPGGTCCSLIVMEVDLSILLVSRECVTQEKRRVKHVSNTCQLQHTVCTTMHSYGVLQYLMEAACPLKHRMKGKLTCSGVSEQQKPIWSLLHPRAQCSFCAD